MLLAQSDNQLLVGLLLAVLVKDAHVSLAPVEGLGRFTEAAGETVVHEGELQDTLEGIQNGHLALGSLGGDFDLLGGIGGVVLFYVRLERTGMLAMTVQSFNGTSVNQASPPSTPISDARRGQSAGRTKQVAKKVGFGYNVPS